MNEPLLLRGKAFNHAPAQAGGSVSLPKDAKVTVEHVRELRDQLEGILQEWPKEELGNVVLVTARYTRIAAKSNRFGRLLGTSSADPSSRIVGARFDVGQASDGTRFKHVMVYAVPLEDIKSNIALLQACEAIMVQRYPGGTVLPADVDNLRKRKLPKNSPVPTTTFAQIMRDAWFCERLWLDSSTPNTQGAGTVCVTLYEHTALTPEQVLETFVGSKALGRLERNRVTLLPDEYEALRTKAPYFIAMALNTDWNQVAEGMEPSAPALARAIPEPGDEPTIGVIDYAFDSSAYFSDWVDYQDMDQKSPSAPRPATLEHGTAVASLVVDGPALNARLDDGCGRFKVKFFGISHETTATQPILLQRIQRIVDEHHHEIKVWNLSIGSDVEVDRDFISPVAALLDELQSKYDVLFVVAGTNKPKDIQPNQPFRIGSPADSINSIVVTSVDTSGLPADYDRSGPVLSFFAKPDVAAVGGTRTDKLTLWHADRADPAGWQFQGTSFAAPWVARKAAFLIHKMGLPRELAKALLMDAAQGWKDEGLSVYTGFGVVPHSIRDVLYTPTDEFRFMVYGKASAKHTDCQEFYIPYRDSRQPFVARATMAYFPPCDINQGVDYTQLELGLQFGRVKNGSIQSLDKNAQADEGARTYEAEARKHWRKWDPVKRCAHTAIERRKPLQVFDDGTWGFKVTRTPRFAATQQEVPTVPFGLVCTFKNLDGKNQIQEFIAGCKAEHWLVDRLDIDVATTLYGDAQTDISLE